MQISPYHIGFGGGRGGPPWKKEIRNINIVLISIIIDKIVKEANFYACNSY